MFPASAIDNVGPVAQRIRERDSAEVEVARSNRARSTKLKSYGGAELERRESLKLVYVGSNPTSVASLEVLTRSTLES